MSTNERLIQLATVKGDCTIKQAMKSLNDSTLEIVLVADEADKLIGVATDGDIRRAIINDATLDTPIRELMNRNFTALRKGSSRNQITRLMKNDYIKLLPILDDEGRVADIVSLKDLWQVTAKENKVVLMAGGLGTRLRPLTENRPKPMLKIGDKPILEHIITRFREFGYYDLLVAVNYKGDIIEKYFQDGSDLDVSIDYIREDKRLGTAGAIRLAKERLGDKPFFVMNADLLTKVNFENFMNEHIKQNNELTVAIKSYDYIIPYGVVNLANNQVKALQEKPSFSCLVSGGIYCLNPSVIDLIPEDTYCDITDIISRMIREERKVGSFLINDYWLDIGTVNDYNKAIEEIAASDAKFQSVTRTTLK